MSDREFYKLDCFACGRTVTLPAADGLHPCPHCSAVLRIEWNAERNTFSCGGENFQASGNTYTCSTIQFERGGDI